MAATKPQMPLQPARRTQNPVQQPPGTNSSSQPRIGPLPQTLLQGQNGVPVAQSGQTNNVTQNPALQRAMAQAASAQSNAAQVFALLAPHMESLTQAYRAGNLSEEQRQQLQVILATYGRHFRLQQTRQQSQQSQPQQSSDTTNGAQDHSAQSSVPSGTQQRSQDAAALHAQNRASPNHPQPNSTASNPSTLHPALLLKSASIPGMPPPGYVAPNGWTPTINGAPPPPIAGTKRKTPPPSNPSAEQQHAPLPPAAQQRQPSQQPVRPPTQQSSSYVAPDPIKNLAIQFNYRGSSELDAPDPRPQPWPNAVGSRPTLTGGLGGASLTLCTPTLLVHPSMDTEVLDPTTTVPVDSTTAASNGPGGTSTLSKDTKPGGGLVSNKRTVMDIITSVDPNVKVDPDVEDFMLELADEFIDSATHFACRLAQHRGSDSLDAKDLQLYLGITFTGRAFKLTLSRFIPIEGSMNLRIPGHSSDDTRVSMSLSHASATGANSGAADLLALTTGTGARVGKLPGQGNITKATKASKAEKNKDKEKDADIRLGRGLRSIRLAAVKNARR
ncbi:transcription initiation factor TFIID subunit A-domain-containing protein [Cantharellus anzutake]|uniref:transcription initiation factor TFIID subunit A-domain-containing protein n=1 Tax=Cantharellus anzutake TaxID=1750568 RepID=UPI0019033EF1|nr:transcription initiation factor TFIID subunit A-domain-containing protein [Cantharellus anzutake]KAF8331916.1 transcription initiation factor TFIID subunit A-domain-containing protein [Cantharellus anzutake]